ncbi:Undefined function [Listeria monocytogenes N53-1]|nr:Undefined function [Listeria monocytogenes]CCQ22693.1 Undefined function [Listeria monocytogenes N53-1]
MNELLKIFLSMALTSVILIPLVWILQRIFNRYLSKGKIYYSWMIVFFFLTIPFAYQKIVCLCGEIKRNLMGLLPS